MAGVPKEQRTCKRDETLKENRELTPKQLHFCRCVASGMSQAAAYREAYDVKEDSKQSTSWQSGSRLMADPRVKARVDKIIAAKEMAIVNSAASDKALVLQKLRSWADDATQADANKIRAAELLGKVHGMFTEVVDDKRKQRTSAQIADELEDRIRALLSEAEITSQDAEFKPPQLNDTDSADTSQDAVH